MVHEAEADYGPLAALIGIWRGDDGMDVAPEPDGTDHNPYYETIQFVAAGDVDNADEQELAIVHYTQVVQRLTNDEIFHHQCGYWLWHAETQRVMHSFTLPRAVSVIAGGEACQTAGRTVLTVAAGQGYVEWPIAQSPFMQQKANTLAFTQRLEIEGERLHYRQTTLLDIYGRRFEHTDQNRLKRIG